ncbi:MAG TPA: TraR/DksA C4-type zinc finger protein [Candidatus Paceibacterota bacterium]
MTHPDLPAEVLQELRTRLEGERALVLSELGHIGRVNPENPSDWEATPQHINAGEEADRNIAADRIEGFEENTAILKELETRLNGINDALTRMDSGIYGICDVGHEPIKLARLRANPAATTCVKHMTEKE